MSPAQALLLRVTSAQWLKMDDEARAVVLDAIHEVVPARLQLATVLGHKPEAFPFFIDAPTQLGFFFIFGQRFLMGLTPEGLKAAQQRALKRYEDDDDGMPRLYGHELMPQRAVDVPPMFAGEAELDTPRWAKLGAGGPLEAGIPKDGREALTKQGWRLPSEAEIDLLRTLSTHCSLPRLDTGLCADEWHDSYDGAPASAQPWGTGTELYRGLDLWERPPRSLRRRDHHWRRVRPFSSLFDEAFGYSPEAVAARAAEPPMETLEPGEPPR